MTPSPFSPHVSYGTELLGRDELVFFVSDPLISAVALGDGLYASPVEKDSTHAKGTSIL
jgi:hypothetical protein